MLQNYLKIAWRNLHKYKFYSLINIFGLGIGIAAFLFILLYVQDELSYDRYHEHASQIVRVDFHAKLGENEVITAENVPPAGPVFTSNYRDRSLFNYRSYSQFPF